MESIKGSTEKTILYLVRNGSAERVRSVPDTDVRLRFVKSGCPLGDIPTIRDANVEKESTERQLNMIEVLREYL